MFEDEEPLLGKKLRQRAFAKEPNALDFSKPTSPQVVIPAERPEQAPRPLQPAPVDPLSTLQQPAPQQPVQQEQPSKNVMTLSEYIAWKQSQPGGFQF